MSYKFQFISLPLICLLSACQFLTKDAISYNRDIRPILNENCLSCHGGVKQMGGFSLLFEEFAFQSTESGKPAIIRGNHKKSELYKRLVHHDPEMRMPQEKDALTVCFLKSVKTDEFNHAPAQLFMHTGNPRTGRPGFGAWVTYGLGTENKDLSGFIVLKR